jgi:transcriptional regulator with XRE-family HTH domain
MKEVINKMTNKKGYGEFIATHRKLSGYKSQRSLADKCGITSATLSRIESEIQKPTPETLKQLAPFLTSTSLVEIMVVCGYWGEDDLLVVESDEIYDEVFKGASSYATPKAIQMLGRVYRQIKKETTPSNEEEFIKSIDLTDKEILEQYDLKVDGRSLTEAEAKGFIAYIRSIRQMNQ